MILVPSKETIIAIMMEATPTCTFGKSWVAQRVWAILLFPEESHLWRWGLFKPYEQTMINTLSGWTHQPRTVWKILTKKVQNHFYHWLSKIDVNQKEQKCTLTNAVHRQEILGTWETRWTDTTFFSVASVVQSVIPYLNSSLMMVRVDVETLYVEFCWG